MLYESFVARCVVLGQSREKIIRRIYYVRKLLKIVQKDYFVTK